MKRFLKIIFSLVILLSFTSNVNAASYNTISVSTSNTSTPYEYVDGLELYYNTSSGYPLYILNSDTVYTYGTQLTDPKEVDYGFTYIINNSNVTSSTYQNYYIAQVAILWYQDYLNGNDENINVSTKNYIKNHTTETVCYYINKLVNNAINYASTGNSIEIEDKNITFEKVGSYYYSEEIEVITRNLRSTPTIKFYNAPTSTTVINNSLKQSGEGSFQIRVPASSLTNFDEKDFVVSITGSDNNYTVYKYSNYGNKDAILGHNQSTSSNNVEESFPVNITGIDTTNVRIKLYSYEGNYISGITYNIYSGNCLSDTCDSADLVYTFTTKNTYVELENILTEGTYTLVRKTNTTKYDLNAKELINIKDTESTQTILLEENYNLNDDNSNNTTETIRTKINFNIYNDINDSTDIIKIYSNEGNLIESYRSNQPSYNTTLYEGTYYIVDTQNNFDKLYFKITDEGKLKVKYDNEYVNVNSINLDKEKYKDTIIEDNNTTNNNTTNNNTTNNTTNNNTINKQPEYSYDETTNTYYIKNLDNVDSIQIQNSATANADVKVNWISNIVDCPKTAISSTIKYILGAIIIGLGVCLTIKNVKKSKNNI